MIPDSFKQDLLNRVDIVDLVSRYVRLKKGGANYQGLCPFHTEKTPSFTVSPAKPFYHCFGCGAHGNAIGFLMAYSGLGYIDAVKDLAASAGVQMPEWQPRTPEQAARKEREPGLLGRDIDFFIGRADQPGYRCEQIYPAAGLNSITYGLTVWRPGPRGT